MKKFINATLVLLLISFSLNIMAQQKADYAYEQNKKVAPKYKDLPANVVFEILNEPNGQLTPELWNGFLAEALAIIRKTNPTRTVIIGPGFWNQIPHLEELRLPENDQNIIVTIHYYSPMKFTHQGARWAGAEANSWLGTKWGSDEDKKAIRDDLRKAKDWSVSHNRPILLGEFGAYDNGDIDSRVRYTSFVARTAEEFNFSWTYWQFDSDFIVYDIPNKQWVKPIHDALIPVIKN
jgi:endoglucanase